MSQRLQEIKERLNAASIRPWLAVEDYDGKDWFVASTGADNNNHVWYITTDHVHCDMVADAEKDARLIANAPADIAWLVAQLEDAQRKIERLSQMEMVL